MNLKGPVSVSRLQRFEGCPWSYYKKYELKADDPVGEMAELGKLQHGIIAEAISQNCAATSEAFDSLMVDVAAGELSYSKDEAKELAQLWSKYSPHYEKIKAVTIKALNLWREKTKGEVVLEKHFIKPLPCGVSLQGYIDFLIPNKVIWDWKTGHNWEKYLNSPQLALYAWGTDSLQAEKAYVFLEFDRPIFQDNFSVKQAVQWANNLCLQIDFAYEIAEEEGPEAAFPKRQGAACSMCGFKEQCADETKDKLGVVIPSYIEDQETALETAKTLLHLETLVERAKKLLEAYCSAEGAFELNGEWFAIYPGSLKKEWDKSGVYNMIKDFPEEQLLKMLNIDSRGVEAVIKEMPFFEPVIKAFCTESQGEPKFKHQKKPPEGYRKSKKKIA